MRLLRDLWATSPRRTAVVAAPRSCSAPAGRRPRRRWPARCWSTARRRCSSLLAVGAGRRRAQRPRRRPGHGRAHRRLGGRRAPPAVPGRASGRTCRRWRPRRSASCSTGSTATSTRSASELRGSGVRIAQSLAVGVAVDRHRARRLVAGRASACSLLAVLLVVGAAPARPRRIAPGPDGRGGGLVRPRRRDGGVDPRPGRRAHQPGPAVRAAAVRPARQRGAAPRAAGCGRCRRGSPRSRPARSRGSASRLVVVGGVWALATGRIDGARLTAVWLLALAFGGTVEHVSRMVPELQYALGAWGRVQLLRDVAAGAGRRRARRSTATSSVRGLTFRYGESDAGRRPALRDVSLTFAPRPLVRADRAHRLGQVDAGQGAHPGRRRAARHGVPRRRRPARPRPRGAAPVDRGRAAAHRDPGRHAGREHRAVRPGPADRAGRGRWTSWGSTAWVGRPAGRAGHPARRGRLRAVRRAGAARRVRPDPGPRPARGDPRRGDRADGPGHRGAGAAGHRAAARAAGSASSSRTGCRRCGAATRSSCSPTARCVEAGPLRESRALRRAAGQQPRARSPARPAPVGGGRRRCALAERRRDRRAAAGRAGGRRADRRAAAEGRPAAAAASRRRPAPCARSSGWRPTTRGTASARWRCSWCMVLLGLDGAVLPLAVGRPGRRRRRPAAGRRSASSPALLVAHADCRTTPALVPGVVGPADAADQPAAGARADRPAPGQHAHPGRGGRAGRRHRAGGACSPTT